MKEAISFYTNILDFKMKYPESSADDRVVNLINGDAGLQLTSLKGDQQMGIAVNTDVDGVDNLFGKYLKRGLDISNKKGSPVHQGRTDQSRGRREFYVTDADGNTLRFGKPIQ